MGSTTFSCADLGAMMSAKGTVTRAILDLIEKNDKVCYINSDGTGTGNAIADAMDKYPNRVLDVGIQEQNMVTLAAGLALKGYIPFCQTFGPFLCIRALDQIQNDVAYNDVPVRLIGTHAGITSTYGPTHHTILEFSIMNAMPNMTMVSPSDANQCIKLIEASIAYPSPIYIRIPRGEEPNVYEKDYEYVIGKAILTRPGKDLTIIATGSGVYNSLMAAKILEKKGYDIRVVDMHTIKPIDREAIVSAATETNRIVTVEDHNILGGLGSRVADVIMEEGISAKVKKIGINDHFVDFGGPDELYKHFGWDSEGIAKTVEEFINI